MNGKKHLSYNIKSSGTVKIHQHRKAKEQSIRDINVKRVAKGKKKTKFATEHQ